MCLCVLRTHVAARGACVGHVVGMLSGLSSCLMTHMAAVLGAAHRRLHAYPTSAVTLMHCCIRATALQSGLNTVLQGAAQVLVKCGRVVCVCCVGVVWCVVCGVRTLSLCFLL